MRRIRPSVAWGVLLMSSLSLFPRLLVAHELDVTSLVGEDWYGLYLNGAKAGYSVSSVNVGDDGEVRVVEDARFQVSMAGVKQDMRVYSERCYAADGNLDRINYQVVDPAGLKEFVARVEGDEMLLTTTVGGEKTEQRLPRPKESLKDILKQVELVGPDAKVGDEIQFSVFDPMYQREIEGTSRIADTETRVFNGAPTRVFLVQSAMASMGIESTSYVAEDGTVLEDVIADIITMRIEPEDMAKDVNYSNDVIVSNAALLDTPIANPRSREALRLRLRGPIKADHRFSDERQTITAVDDYFEFEGRRVSLEGFEPAHLPFDLGKADKASPWCPLRWVAGHVQEAIDQNTVGNDADSPAALRQWLEPTAFVQCDAPPIVEKAREIVGDETDALAVSGKLCAWVHDHVHTMFSAQLTNALEVLERLEGDCTEYSILFIGLARAAGLPAREVAGLIYMEGAQPGFYFHQWAKVWVGKWIDVDPTFDQPLADATHIKLAEGDLFQQARLIPIIGRLTVEVVNGQAEGK